MHGYRTFTSLDHLLLRADPFGHGSHNPDTLQRYVELFCFPDEGGL